VKSVSGVLCECESIPVETLEIEKYGEFVISALSDVVVIGVESEETETFIVPELLIVGEEILSPVTEELCKLIEGVVVPVVNE